VECAWAVKDPNAARNHQVLETNTRTQET